MLGIFTIPSYLNVFPCLGKGILGNCIPNFIDKTPLPLLHFYLTRIFKYFAVLPRVLYEFKRMDKSKLVRLKGLARAESRPKMISLKHLNFKIVQRIVRS